MPHRRTESCQNGRRECGALRRAEASPESRAMRFGKRMPYLREFSANTAYFNSVWEEERFGVTLTLTRA